VEWIKYINEQFLFDFVYILTHKFVCYLYHTIKRLLLPIYCETSESCITIKWLLYLIETYQQRHQMFWISILALLD